MPLAPLFRPFPRPYLTTNAGAVDRAGPWEACRGEVAAPSLRAGRVVRGACHRAGGGGPLPPSAVVSLHSLPLAARSILSGAFRFGDGRNNLGCQILRDSAVVSRGVQVPPRVFRGAGADDFAELLARYGLHRPGLRVPAPRNINVNLGGFARRFSTVSDRFSGSWCRFPESWGQDGENGEKTAKERAKMGEKWPKKSGGKLT